MVCGGCFVNQINRFESFMFFYKYNYFSTFEARECVNSSSFKSREIPNDNLAAQGLAAEPSYSCICFQIKKCFVFITILKISYYS